MEFVQISGQCPNVIATCITSRIYNIYDYYYQLIVLPEPIAAIIYNSIYPSLDKKLRGNAFKKREWDFKETFFLSKIKYYQFLVLGTQIAKKKYLANIESIGDRSI